MSIRAVAFDIDGTLYPEYKFYLKNVPLVMRYPRFMRAYARARKSLRSDAYAEPFHEAQASRVLASLRKPVNRDSCSAAAQLIDRRISSYWQRVFRNINPFHGTGEALQELQAHGYAVAALSDFPLGSKLEVLGLDSLFSVRFSAEDTGHLKPSPVPFNELASRLSCSPEEVLYVGNSLSKDIIGARNSGMYAAHFIAPARWNRKGRQRLIVRLPDGDDAKLAHIVFSSYQDLPAAVDQLQELIRAL